jgi:hypothetical protein
MTHWPKADDITSIDADQEARQNRARPHCRPDQLGGRPTVHMDIVFHLSIIPKGSVLFVLDILSGNLSWPKLDPLAKSENVDHNLNRNVDQVSLFEYPGSGFHRHRRIQDLIKMILEALFSQATFYAL